MGPFGAPRAPKEPLGGIQGPPKGPLGAPKGLLLEIPGAPPRAFKEQALLLEIFFKEQVLGGPLEGPWGGQGPAQGPPPKALPPVCVWLRGSAACVVLLLKRRMHYMF